MDEKIVFEFEAWSQDAESFVRICNDGDGIMDIWAETDAIAVPKGVKRGRYRVTLELLETGEYER